MGQGEPTGGEVRATLRITPDQGEIPRPASWTREPRYRLGALLGEPYIAPAPEPSDPESVDVELPAELAPRLAELDTGSDDAVLAFINAFGPLGTAHGEYAAVLMPRELRLRLLD